MSEIRYEDVGQQVQSVFESIRNQHFPELTNAKVKIVFDLKKRVSDGKIILGKIKRTNELEKFFTVEEAGSMDGYDYILFLDKKAWELGTPEDHVRLVRHELRHTSVDDSNDKPYRLRGHTIEDFHEEVELNRDDPRWAERLAITVQDAYANEE